MSDPSLALQKALVAALKADGALSGDVAVYDSVPADASFPYVSFGPSQILPDQEDCIDGAEVIQQVDVWSRKPGYPECRQIAAAVVAAVDDKDLALDAHRMILIEHQGTNYLREQDGLTSHAAVTFRALIQSN